MGQEGNFKLNFVLQKVYYMKQVFITIAVLLSSAYFAQAQQTQKSLNPKWVKNQKVISKILNTTKGIELKKTRAADERVIANAYEELTIDSTTYTYSAGRGCQLDKQLGVSIDNIDYDHSVYYSISMPATLDYKSSRVYNGNNQVTVEMDSNFVSPNWEPSNRTTNTYNASNQMSTTLMEYWNGTSWQNGQQIIYTYTGNNLTQELAQSWNGTMWGDSWKQEYVYSGSNLTEETFSIYNQMNSAWEGSDKTLYSYNANNQIETEIYQNYNMNAWENSDKTIYTYNTTTNKIEKLEMQIWNNNQWENDIKVDITWTGNSLLVADFQTWNGLSWDKLQQITLTFNSLGYPTTDMSETWNGTAYVFDPANNDYKERWYYEPYNNNVGVQDVANNVFGGVTIFPNPTNETLTIAFQQPTNTAKNVLVMDMMGKILLQTTVEAASNTTSINLSGLTNGNYLVELNDESGIRYTTKVVKQ